jgi:hypothetical protein
MACVAKRPQILKECSDTSAGYGSPWPMAARYAQIVEKVYVDIFGIGFFEKRSKQIM